MGACGGSQYWARELTTLGHKVRLIQSRLVKAFVMGNKNDVMDVRAIWMAVQQPGKEIAVKTVARWVNERHPDRQLIFTSTISLLNLS